MNGSGGHQHSGIWHVPRLLLGLDGGIYAVSGATQAQIFNLEDLGGRDMGLHGLYVSGCSRGREMLKR